MRFLPLFLLFPLCFSYKILVFSPTISRSHMISNGRIADTLAEAGHQVVLFEPDFLGIFHKVEAAKLARRWPVFNFTTGLLDVIQSFSAGDIFDEDSVISMNFGLGAYTEAFNQHCRDLINRDEVLAQLREEKFDAYFGEQINLCGHGLAHAIGIKSYFWVSSCTIGEPMAWVTGMPFPHSYVPATVGVDMDDKPTYSERANNLLFGISQLIGVKYYNNKLTQIYREKFGPDFPHIEEIAGNSDIIFVSTDEFIEFNRPILPNVIHIGGLGLTDSKTKLDEEFGSLMDRGELGVIYFSLGTIVNTTVLPQFAMQTVLETARQFPKYQFIIKVDKYDQFAFSLASSIPNVFITSWVPQPAILAHRRLRLFITHAGYNGVMEAARAGIPLITMPFMFDQTKNSRAVAASGWGIALKRQNLRDEPAKLTDAIREMLDNNKYKEKAVRISNLVRKKPFNATERLVKYTEFVLENDGIKELLVEGRNLNFIIYFNLDIIIPFCIAILTIFAIFIGVIFSFISRISPVKVQKIKIN